VVLCARLILQAGAPRGEREFCVIGNNLMKSLTLRVQAGCLRGRRLFGLAFSQRLCSRAREAERARGPGSHVRGNGELPGAVAAAPRHGERREGERERLRQWVHASRARLFLSLASTPGHLRTTDSHECHVRERTGEPGKKMAPSFLTKDGIHAPARAARKENARDPRRLERGAGVRAKTRT